MSGTPRRINTDRSLGAPSSAKGAGGAGGGGEPPRPPIPPQGDAPLEDDGQSFFRPQGDDVPPAQPAPDSDPAGSARHTGQKPGAEISYRWGVGGRSENT